MSEYDDAKAALADALIRYLSIAEREGKSQLVIQTEIALAMQAALAEREAA